MLYEKQKNEKTNHRLGEKYFQIICPIQDLYPEYIKNLREQPNLKMGKPWTDTSNIHG